MLVKVRIHKDPSAIFADYHFLVRGDIYKPLRRNSIETAAASISVEHGNHSKMVVAAAPDTLVGTHCPRIYLVCTQLACSPEFLFFLRSGFHDRGKFLFLGFQILVLDISLFPDLFDLLDLVRFGRVVDVDLAVLNDRAGLHGDVHLPPEGGGQQQGISSIGQRTRVRKGESEGIEVEVAFQYVNEFHENVLGFCNNIYNGEGGTHLTGFKTTFTTVMNQYARELGILKEKAI